MSQLAPRLAEDPEGSALLDALKAHIEDLAQRGEDEARLAMEWAASAAA